MPPAWNLIKKEASIQVWSCEFCGSFENLIFIWKPGKLPDETLRRRGHSQMLYKIGALQIFTNIIVTYLCRSLFFNKVAVARFTGDKANTLVHNPAWIVTLWDFVSLLFTGMKIYWDYPGSLSQFHRLHPPKPTWVWEMEKLSDISINFHEN